MENYLTLSANSLLETQDIRKFSSIRRSLFLRSIPVNDPFFCIDIL